MRYLTEEAHKEMFSLIDGICKSPSLTDGVRHRAKRLKEKLEKLSECDNVIQLPDLKERTREVIEENSLLPFRRSTPLHRQDYPEEWDAYEAIEKAADHVAYVADDELIDDIIPEAIAIAIDDHIIGIVNGLWDGEYV
jgi:hypothetical protein